MGLDFFFTLSWRVLLATIALCWSVNAFAAMTEEEFLKTAGTQDFRNGNYETAIEKYQELLKQHRDDPLILRFTGVAFYKLKDMASAQLYLEKAAAQAPNDDAIHFWLGATYYERGNGIKASQAFQRVLTLAPEGSYAGNSRNYLKNISGNSTKRATKPWDVNLTVGTEYDDNIDFASEPTKSARIIEGVQGGYNILDSDDWRIRFEGAGFFGQHINDDAKRFDITIAEGGTDISYYKRVNSALELLPSVNYSYRMEYEGWERDNTSHSVVPGINITLYDRFLTQLYYAFKTERYTDDGREDDATSQDGSTHAGGVNQYVYFDNRKHYISLGYGYRNIDAEGINFDAFANRFTLGFGATLPLDIKVDGSATYKREIYPDFQGPVARMSFQQIYSLQVRKNLTEQLEVSASYRYDIDNSNYNELEAKRQIGSLTFTYAF